MGTVGHRDFTAFGHAVVVEHGTLEGGMDAVVGFLGEQLGGVGDELHGDIEVAFLFFYRQQQQRRGIAGYQLWLESIEFSDGFIDVFQYADDEDIVGNLRITGYHAQIGVVGGGCGRGVDDGCHLVTGGVEQLRIIDKEEPLRQHGLVDLVVVVVAHHRQRRACGTAGTQGGVFAEQQTGVADRTVDVLHDAVEGQLAVGDPVVVVFQHRRLIGRRQVGQRIVGWQVGIQLCQIGRMVAYIIYQLVQALLLQLVTCCR